MVKMILPTAGSVGDDVRITIKEGSMKIHIDPVIAGRIKTAWGKLSDAQKARVAPMLARASHHAQTVASTGQAPPLPADVPRQALLIASALNDDKDQVIANLERGVVVHVGTDGEIYGTGKYEELDPGWTEAGAVWLEYYAKMKEKAPFLAAPETITIPNKVQIAIAGDWGTGNWRPHNPAPAADVGRQMDFLKADFTIHLGDTYYAGTDDQEQQLLVTPWPAGSNKAGGALTLNSNHEMYSGAAGYFGIALKDDKFKLQNKCSYFALQNDAWVIVGLDTAYYADEEKMYLEGSLLSPGDPQVQLDFLKEKIATGKKVLILTHHGGLSLDGGTKTALWNQVIGVFPSARPPACWYWGHEHAAVIYSFAATGPTLCRCCGHGAIPWGFAKVLDKNANVDWFESRPANDPEIPQRVLNGFAMLSLDGPNLKETFYDENGGVAWSLG
jgi:hypothetical protein